MRRELAQVLESPDFDASRRSREFLRFVVEETLAGRADELSQARIALRVFGRREDFDATVDPIVRIQAGRLRRSLERYYLLRGSTSTLRLELPRGGYVPTFRTVQGPPAAPEEAPAVPAVDDWLTVVVGRFDNATGDPAHDTTADRIREVLATELGRHSDIRVASFGQRTSDRGGPAASWRFTLAGSLRSAGPGVEVSARLTDATSGLQLWADTYRAALERGGSDPPVDDAIRVVAARVASEEGVIVQTLAAEARRTGFAANSFGAVLRSYDFYVARDGRLFPEALDALRDAVARDPECSLAWTRLARLSVANHAFEIAEIDTPIAAAITYAQSGVRLDPSSRRARCVLGTQLVGGDLRAAEVSLR